MEQHEFYEDSTREIYLGFILNKFVSWILLFVFLRLTSDTSHVVQGRWS